MLPKQLQIIKEYLSKSTSLDDTQKELLKELDFIDKNDTINKEFATKDKIRVKLYESFSIAAINCPACGKKI